MMERENLKELFDNTVKEKSLSLASNFNTFDKFISEMNEYQYIEVYTEHNEVKKIETYSFLEKPKLKYYEQSENDNILEFIDHDKKFLSIDEVFKQLHEIYGYVNISLESLVKFDIQADYNTALMTVTQNIGSFVLEIDVEYYVNPIYREVARNNHILQLKGETHKEYTMYLFDEINNEDLIKKIINNYLDSYNQ